MGAKQSKSRSSKKRSNNQREVSPERPGSNIGVEDGAASSSAAQNAVDSKGKSIIMEDESSVSGVSLVSSGHALENYTSNHNVQNSAPAPTPAENNCPAQGMYYDPNYYPQSGNNYPYSYNDPNPARYHQPSYPSYSHEQYTYFYYSYSRYSQEPQQQPPQSFEDEHGAQIFGRY